MQELQQNLNQAATAIHDVQTLKTPEDTHILLFARDLLIPTEEPYHASVETLLCHQKRRPASGLQPAGAKHRGPPSSPPKA